MQAIKQSFPPQTTMLHYFGKSRLPIVSLKKGRNDTQIYTVARKAHTMCTILWPSQHAFKSFEISFQALLCFQ